MNVRALPLPTLLAIVSVGFSPVSQAAVLVDYAFTGSTASTDAISTATPTSVAANITSILTKSSYAATKLSIQSETAWSTRPYVRAETTGTGASSTPTAATAVAAGNYFDLTLTAGLGYELDLTSFTFVVTKGGTADTRGLAIQNSVTGFSTNGSTNLELSNPTTNTITSTGAVNGGDYQDIGTARSATFTNFTMDLTGAAYQNLSTITFRIFFYTTNNSQSVEFDNFVVNGSVVPVPEPSTAAALLAGGMFMLVLRRRVRAA